MDHLNRMFGRLHWTQPPEKEPFIYQALNASRREIRLLELLPHSGRSKHILECRISHVSLDAEPSPQYETISYYWGDPTPNRRIRIDGRILWIPVNTEDAIRRMVLCGESRKLWIDAVCINQADLVERSLQVALMGAIYSRCTACLIWLGRAKISTARALKDVEAIMEKIKQDTNGMQEFADIIAGRLQSTKSPTGINKDVTALGDLFDRPWFRRVWIVQEVTLAPRNLCFWGSYEFSLQTIVFVALWLRKHPYDDLELDGKTFYMHRGILAVAVLGATSQAMFLGYDLVAEHSLTVQLLQNHLRETSDPRDRLFGALGIAYKDGEIPQLLTPDYSKRYAEVLTDAMRHTVEIDGNFGLFRLLSNQKEDTGVHGLPSWVFLPDQQLDFEHPMHTISLKNYRGRPPQKHTSSTSSDDSRRRLLNQLLVSGILIDHMEILSNPLLPRQRRDGRGTFESAMSSLEELQNLEKYNTRNTKQDFQRTIVADMFGGAMPEPLPREHCIDLSVVIKELNRTGKIRDPKMDMSIRPYCRALIDACMNRKFMVGKSGKIGLVPRVCRPGDVIVVPRHAYLGHPLALRETGGVYKMLGACYVHGVMYDDEVDQLFECRWGEEQAFTIE